MLKLYGCLRSRATRPYWLLSEIGLPFEQVPVIQSYRLADPAAADAPFNTASPAFLAINPQGQIPVLDDDGMILTESLAITFHIARKYGDDLGPRDLAEGGQCLQWMMLGATAVEPQALEIMYAYGRKEQETEPGRARISAATEMLKRPLSFVDRHLQGRDWLVDARFTVADIMLAECIRYAQPHAPALAPYPALRAWIERAQARPAFKAMMEKRNAEPL